MFISPVLRRSLLATTMLSSFLSAPSSAQQTLQPIEIVVPRVAPPPAEAQPSARRSVARPARERAAAAPAPVTAPAAAAPLLVASPTAIPTPEQVVGSSVTVVTAAEIERDQRRTVPDVLSTLPGLHVAQSGGPGSLTSVFMRGTNSNHTKVLIDGINVGDPAFGSVDFSHLLAGDIERVEVLRGPQSGLYGSEALGGVISITTKRGSGPPKASVTLEGGSFGTFNQNVNVSGSYNKFDYAFNVSHYRSTDTPVTPLEILPPGRRRNNDWIDNLTVSTRLGAEVNDNLRFNFVARYTDSRLRLTTDEFDLNTFTNVPRALQDRQHVEQFHTRSEAVWQSDDRRFQSVLGGTYSEQRTTNVSPDPSVSRDATGERTRVDWRNQYEFLPEQIVLAGVDYEQERFTKPGFAAQNANRGGFLELQSRPFDRAFVAANVRFDDNDRFGGHTTWRVAPSYILAGSETKLKGSVGTGFKAPTLSQLFEDFPQFFFLANPDLKPEESLGYDVGFEQPLAGNRVRVGATHFRNDLTNLIAANDTFTTLINIGRATTSGVEAFATVTVTDRMRIRADYTYTETRDEITHRQLLRRPRNKASLTGFYDATDQLTLSATLLYVGEFADVDRLTAARLINPGYTLVNVAANYQVNPNTKVFARVDNLFNEKYEPVTGFLGRGIGVFGGVRVTN
jgi:vitamin B12 transporter